MLISKDYKIFIAGHNGMVGSAIRRAFQKKGYTNLLCPGKKDLDLLNFVDVKEWFETNRPDIVILAAAKVGGIYSNSIYSGDFILENLKIQTNVIENAWKNRVKRFLFLGSSCIYPKFAKQPLKEEYLLTGSLEISNQSYALAKIAGIKLCTSLTKQYGFDALSLMPTNLYGPGDNYNQQNSHVLPAMISKFYNAKKNKSEKINCWGTGTPKREFLFVDDLADASIFILENVSINDQILFDSEKNFSGIINVGLGIDISIKELAKLVSSLVGYEGKILWDKSKPDGTPRKLLDISKLNQLGWKAKTSLKKGIKLTLESYIKEIENKTIRI